jgi:hypothetical protein
MFFFYCKPLNCHRFETYTLTCHRVSHFPQTATGFRTGNLNPTKKLRQPILRYSPIVIMPPAGPSKRAQPGSTRDGYSVRLRCSKKRLQLLTGLSRNTALPVCQKREVRPPWGDTITMGDQGWPQQHFSWVEIPHGIIWVSYNTYGM